MNLPIYRAKKIDSDEYVEGFLCPFMLGGAYKYKITDSSGWVDDRIDSTTLNISFDNGKTWKTFEEVQEALGDK